MKRIISVILLCVLSLNCLTGCSKTETPVIDEKPNEATEIVLPNIENPNIKDEYYNPEDSGNNNIVGDTVEIVDVDKGTVVKPVEKHIYNGGTWYYDQLSSKEQKAYEKIKKTLENAYGHKTDELVFSDISLESLLRAYRSVIDDNPQIFIQNTGEGDVEPLYDAATGKSDGLVFTMHYDEYWTEGNAIIAQAETEAEVKKIMKELDKIDGDYYKILWLYHRLIKNIEYSHDYPWSGSIYGAIVKKECSCEGISEAFEYILNLYGIKTIGVSGMSGFIFDGGSVGGHKWNMVQLDGEWYAFDVTWDISKDLSKFLPYTYFAVNQKDISYAHAPFFSDLVPKATGEKYNYYKYNDLIVKNYSMDELIRVGKKCYSLTPGYFSFKFANKADFNKALKESEYEKWIPEVVKANKLSKWQFSITNNPDLQIIEFAIYDQVQWN